MAHGVKAMMERLDTIGRDRELFHFEERLEETQVRNRAREEMIITCWHQSIYFKRIVDSVDNKTANISVNILLMVNAFNIYSHVIFFQ